MNVVPLISDFCSIEIHSSNPQNTETVLFRPNQDGYSSPTNLFDISEQYFGGSKEIGCRTDICEHFI